MTESKEERAKEFAKAMGEEALRVGKLADRTAALRALRLANTEAPIHVVPKIKAAPAARRSKQTGK